jgi:hypothetical protein
MNVKPTNPTIAPDYYDGKAVSGLLPLGPKMFLHLRGMNEAGPSLIQVTNISL